MIYFEHNFENVFKGQEEEEKSISELMNEVKQ